MEKLVPRLTPILLCGVLASICVAGGPPQDVRYAARPSVAIRQGAFAFEPVVATVPVGQPVTVLGYSGRWLHVSFTPNSFSSTQPSAAIQGYVFEDALSSQPPATQPADAKAPPPSGGVLNSTDYAAANGLDPDAFAKAISDSHDAMKDARAKFEAFTKAGHLGAHKPASASGAPTTQPAK